MSPSPAQKQPGAAEWTSLREEVLEKLEEKPLPLFRFWARAG